MLHTRRPGDSFLVVSWLSGINPQVAVFKNLETLHRKSLRIVVRAHRIDQIAARDKRPLGDVALADNHLTGIRRDAVRGSVEITRHGVNLQGLVDIAGYNAVVVALLLQILRLVIGTLISA